MKFRKVTPGSSAASSPAQSAAWLNAVSEATQYYQENVKLGTPVTSQPSVRPPVKVKNSTGADLAQGEVVQIGDLLTTEVVDKRFWFDGEAYTDGVLAITAEPIKTDAIGPVRLVGDAVARVNVTDTNHRFAEPASGEAVLQSAASGPVQILSVPTSTGVQTLAVVIGSGGGSGSPLSHVLVLEDLPGGGWTEDYATVGTVKCLPVTTTEGRHQYDASAAITNCTPADTIAVDLSATGCCGGEAEAPSGIRINTPIGENNRTYDAAPQNGAIIVTGVGVAVDATVTLTITDRLAASITPAVTNNGNGSWETASFSVASLAEGLLKITATDGGTTQSIAIQYSKAQASGVLASADNPPAQLDMTAATDTGASSTDNVTSDDTPAFDFVLDRSQDATGPQPRLIVDGEYVAVDETIDNSFFGSSLVRALTLASGDALAEGEHTVQGQFWTDTGNASGITDPDDAYKSGTSEPLRVRYDPNATEEAAEERPYGRLGTVATIGGVSSLERVGTCRVPILFALGDRVDGKIIARATTTGSFTESQPCPVDDASMVIINDTEAADPATVTSFQQPSAESQKIASVADRYAWATWDGTNWILRDITTPPPEPE